MDSIISHGVWHYYRPDVSPIDTIQLDKTIFAKNDATGDDWYLYVRAPGPFAEDSLIVIAHPQSDGRIACLSITREFPVPILDGMTVLEITGHDVNDPKPWKTYEQRVYDPVTNTIGEVWTSPLEFVDSVLCKIQLSRTPYGNTDLLTATTNILSNDREAKLWFDGARNWRPDDINVKKLAYVFKLSDADVLDLFTKANAITP